MTSTPDTARTLLDGAIAALDEPDSHYATCATCAAERDGCCRHAAIIESLGTARPLFNYPEIPGWCPGYIAEDDDYEWESRA